jgi:glycolate oxidase
LATNLNINQDFLEALHRICKNIEVGSELNNSYGKDEATKEFYRFEYLVKPTNEREVAEIVKLCNKHSVSITPRGGGSGVSGGASPITGGLVLSTEKLDNIIEINIQDKIVIVESGVVTDRLCKIVEDSELYFPVRPSSAYMSFVGGNVAENSSSINSLKYGSIKDYVLNLQVVLPNGEIIWTGANTSKNSTGPNITQLFVGSEGVLGIITKIVFRLISKPHYEYSLMAEFTTVKELFNSVSAIMRSNLLPCAVEIVDEFSVNLTSNFLKDKADFQGTKGKLQLLVNFDGNNQNVLDETLDKCYEIIKEFVADDILLARTQTEKDKLWKIRMNIGGALTQGDMAYRDIDMAVPVSKLFQFVSSVYEISKRWDVKVACFGHAGNGNLHTMISADTSSDLKKNHFSQAIDQIYEAGIELGGTISGEHGIGILQKKYMPTQYSQPYLNLIKEIKKVFDPNNILNPGKII